MNPTGSNPRRRSTEPNLRVECLHLICLLDSNGHEHFARNSPVRKDTDSSHRVREFVLDSIDPFLQKSVWLALESTDFTHLQFLAHHHLLVRPIRPGYYEYLILKNRLVKPNR